MRALIFSFLCAVIISCGTSDGLPEQHPIDYPVEVGAWKVNSPDQSDWIGLPPTNGIADGDTVTLTQPGDQQLSLVNDTTRDDINNFIATFVDSSITLADSIKGNSVDFIVIGSNPDIFPEVGGGGFTFADHSRWELNIFYSCDEEIEKSGNVIQLRFSHDEPDNQSLIRQYNIEGDGIIDVLDHIVCDEGI